MVLLPIGTEVQAGGYLEYRLPSVMLMRRLDRAEDRLG
jgi:hypothetical protein